MSQSGQVTYFTTKLPCGQREFLTQIFALFGVERAYLAIRSTGPNQEWAKFLEDQDRINELVEEAERLGMPPVLIGHGGNEGEQFIGNQPDLAQLLECLPVENRELRMNLQATAYTNHCYENLLQQIPESVRGDFVPCDIWVRIGGHDLFESSEVEDGWYFGRAEASVSFESYNTPHDWRMFRSLIFSTPAMVKIQHDLELIMGPVERCAYWNV